MSNNISEDNSITKRYRSSGRTRSRSSSAITDGGGTNKHRKRQRSWSSSYTNNFTNIKLVDANNITGCKSSKQLYRQSSSSSLTLLVIVSAVAILGVSTSSTSMTSSVFCLLPILPMTRAFVLQRQTYHHRSFSVLFQQPKATAASRWWSSTTPNSHPETFSSRSNPGVPSIYSLSTPSSRIRPTTSLHAMDSRQLRFLGDFKEQEAEADASSSAFSFLEQQQQNEQRYENQRKYSEFIQQYVAGNSFWSSIMAGTTRQGILSQATKRSRRAATAAGRTTTTTTSSNRLMTSLTEASAANNKKIWSQQVSESDSSSTIAMTERGVMTSSAATSSSSLVRTTGSTLTRFMSSSSSGNGNDISDNVSNTSTNDHTDERSTTFRSDSVANNHSNNIRPVMVGDEYPYEPRRGYGPYIPLSPEERELFRLLRQARTEMNLTSTTLRVAGGWVRDKLLSTPEFARTLSATTNQKDGGGVQRLTSKYKQSSSTVAASMGRQGGKVIGSSSGGAFTGNSKKKNSKTDDSMTVQCQPPVDIDIALDNMLGREYAEHLNEYLAQIGEETHGVGVILQNPEKSKHLETATMKVGTFWIDFVNLRAEEYTQDSRIPDLMRIGTPAEDAFRRDLTINSLFYNVNNGQVEDWTGRGFDDLRRGIVSTPLAPLTTLLDDPLRALRSVRFAARLRFTMDDSLIDAAMDDRVRQALAEKVSRERIGCEVDLMLRSPDPVGAMRLLVRLNLAQTVFPIEKLVRKEVQKNTMIADSIPSEELFQRGIDLLSTNYDHLEECKVFPPLWCRPKGEDSTEPARYNDLTLTEDDDARRFLWYASFVKPFHNFVSKIPEEKKSKRQGKKANRSVVAKLLVDELKRPNREAEAVEKVIKGADEFKKLINGGSDFSAETILLSDILVKEKVHAGTDLTGDESDRHHKKYMCRMNNKQVFCASETDPVWKHAMSFRLNCAKVLRKVGPLWRAALFLAMSEHVSDALREGNLEYVIEGDVFEEKQDVVRQQEIDRYNAFATAMQRLGLIGIWDERPILDGGEVKRALPNIPKGPAFRDVMDEQEEWMTLHPGVGPELLANHLQKKFPEYS